MRLLHHFSIQTGMAVAQSTLPLRVVYAIQRFSVDSFEGRILLKMGECMVW